MLCLVPAGAWFAWITFQSHSVPEMDLSYVGNCTRDEAGFTEDQLASLIQAHQNPYAKQIRTILADYLAGKPIQPVITKIGRDSGLEVFNREYLESPLIALHVQQALGGGMDFRVFSKNRPDKVFAVWVYESAGPNYEVRGFTDAGLDSEQSISLIANAMDGFNDRCILEDARLTI